MLFLLTGSAGSGKSAVLHELANRNEGWILLDLDDARPPAGAGASWWRTLLAEHVARSLREGTTGQDTILAGWTSRAELEEIPGASGLRIAVCLLDCDDRVRLARIERRVASGTWRTHRPEELDEYVRVAASMRSAATERAYVVDTTDLSVSEVADAVERWMAEQRRPTVGPPVR
jgi:RNase adaptor protein for sRNA GlmZ degradation